MIRLPTSDPSALLTKIKQKIDTGKIKSWSYDNENDFTLTQDRWSQEAWLHPVLQDTALNFFIIPPKGSELSKAVYAVFHGRFIEMVLRHFDDDIKDEACASAMPVGRDDVG